ncbi:hypothetical protein NKI19_05715 [Mesorhizobium sp. M0751]|uniref:hypothetical protein n=1 Tax=unclassified Mesorhizobium TaxID=325217 RepID=UPI00333E0850
MRRFLIVGAIMLATYGASHAQTVDEGIHRDAHGPSTMCGFHGADALDLVEQVRASPALRRVAASSRFELFVSADGLTQWSFTRPTEQAYPAITCNRLSRDRQGSLYQTRTMRCEAGRRACDGLFAEFQQLDERFRRAMRK